MDQSVRQSGQSGRSLRRRAAIGTVSSLALASALSLAGSGAALAQDTVLETITVTAQFRKQNLQQTPIAITAFNSETMEARSQTSINQVAAQAPSVTLAPRGAAYGPSMAISIRGVGQADFNPAYEPGVGMYVDDVYYASLTGSIMDLLDLDRVEILRGPQGTLAGKNSIGGAVKLYSKEPLGDGSGFMSATYGSRDRLDLRASSDFAITDNLFARLSGVSKRQDGYVKRLDYGCMFPNSGIPANMAATTNCVMAKEGEINYSAARGILRWDNSGPVAITIIGDYTDDDRITGASVLLDAQGLDTFPISAELDPYGSGLGLDAFVPPYGSYYNYAGYVHTETDTRPSRATTGRSFYRGWGVSGKIDWDVNDSMQLESITAYRGFNSGFSNDNDLGPLQNSLGDGTLDFWSFSQEVRLNGAFGAADQVEWTLGGFYMDQRSTYASYQDLRFSLPAFQQDDPVDSDTKAVFAHVNWIMTDQLTLVGGIRYTDESKDYTFSRKTPDGLSTLPALAPLDGVVGHYAGNKVDWRVAAQYQWSDSLMTYAQVATGFKGGGVNARPFYAPQAVGFDPETLTSYEVGAKTELFDRRLRLNSAFFYSDYTNIQVGAAPGTCPDSVFPPEEVNNPRRVCSLIVNTGSAKAKGVELEANFQPVDGMIIDASASYIDFTYSDTKNRAAFTPEWKWSAGAQYSFWLNDDQSLTPRFDISYNGNIFTSSNNDTQSQIASYILSNARLTWRDEDRGWEASLEVTNIFDKYYLTSIYNAYARAGVMYGSPGHPREWGLTVKKTF